METGNGKITDSVYGPGSFAEGRDGIFKENRISRKLLAVLVGIILAVVSWFTGMQFFARPEKVDARNSQGQESGMLFQENSKAGEGHMPDSDY